MKTGNIDRYLLRSITDRPRQLGRFCKLAPDIDAVTVDVDGSDLEVDVSRMVVGPVTISTPAVDRVGDVLVSSGCDQTHYQNNPVVLWEHGYSGEGGGTMPIALSSDANGNPGVSVTKKAVQAFAHFHGETLLSDQVFRLLELKALRAASVRPEPVISKLVENDETGEIGIRFDVWRLTEWSFVGIGCNQEALVKSIRDGRLNGKALAAPLFRSLSKYAPPRKTFGVGMDPSFDAALTEVKLQYAEIAMKVCELQVEHLQRRHGA